MPQHSPTQYSCIVADPPWNERGGGKIKRGADRHYPLMKTPDIIECMLTAPLWHPSESAHLWLWTTDNHLEDALEVMKAVGFRYIRTMAWVKQRNAKLQIGLGQYLRGSHELCLFGVRGKTIKPAKAPPSVVIAERTKHSRKPEEAFFAIEQVSPGPRLEMFARELRQGWDVWGQQVSEEVECYSDPLLDMITVHEGDESWHDGKGWYYTLNEHPNEGSCGGSCGAFKTHSDLMEHAEKAVFGL